MKMPTRTEFARTVRYFLRELRGRKRFDTIRARHIHALIRSMKHYGITKEGSREFLTKLDMLKSEDEKA